MIKEQLFEKVKNYGVNKSILNEIYERVSKNDNDMISEEFIFELEKYLIEEIKNNNNGFYKNKILETNCFLKALFRNINYGDIEKLYAEAVEYVIDNYDESEFLSTSILKQMRKLVLLEKSCSESKEEPPKNINNQNIDKLEEKDSNPKDNNIDKKFGKKIYLTEKEWFDISKLLSDYYYSIDSSEKDELSEIMGISIGTLRHHINSYKKKKIPILKRLLDKLFQYYNIEDISEIKDILNKKIDEKNQIIIGHKKITEMICKYYNMISQDEREKLANVMQIKSKTLYAYISNFKNEGIPFSEEIFNRLIKYYNLKNINELEIIFEKRFEEEHQKVNKKIETIEIIYKYYSMISQDEKEELASSMGISLLTLCDYIHNFKIERKLFSEIAFNRLLEYYKVEDTDDLRKIFSDKINELTKKYDVNIDKLLCEYFEIIDMKEKEELANSMGISYSTLISYFNKLNETNFKFNLPDNVMQEMIKYYNVEKVSELESIIRNKIDKINEERKINNELFEVLRDYYLIIDADEKKKLANIMGIEYITLSYHMNKKISDNNNIPIELIKNLISYYKLNSELELIDKIKLNIAEKKENKLFYMNISNLICNYYDKVDINGKTLLANIMEITLSCLRNYVFVYKNQNTPFPIEDIIKIFNYYGVKSFDELKQIFGDNINGNNIKNTDNLILEENVSFDINEDIASKVDKDLMFSIMNVNTLNREDYIIVMLLFGGFKDRYYSVESISNFLGIEKEYVLEIYNKCLNEYRNTMVRLLSDKNSKMFLELGNNSKEN